VLPEGTPGQDPLARRLFAHYETTEQAKNIYILTDGTVTEFTPPATYDANGDLLLLPHERVAHAFVGGGGPVAVTDAEATILTDAGYTVD
jgi:hypothetical protein